MKHSISIFTLAAAVLLVGCGGGGGGGGGGVTALPETASGQLAATAQNRPGFGSVSQGPRASGGRTADTTDVDHGSSGAMTVTVNLAGIDTDPDSPGMQEDVVTTFNGARDAFADIGTTSGISSIPYPYVSSDNVFGQTSAGRSIRYVDHYHGDVYRNPSATAADDYWNDHGLWALFFTTHDGTNTNYLTFGQWLYFPGEGVGQALDEVDGDITIDDFFEVGGHYGLFVDGTEHTGDLPTTGSASYAGFTFGYGQDRTRVIGYLLGQVSLRADFVNSRVSGTVSDFAYYDDVASDWSASSPFGSGAEPAADRRDPGWGTVNLEAATINSQGNFEGIAAGGAAADNARGRWGGQFFGNDGAAAPPMIGGTWGVTSNGEDRVRMTGAFGTWKEDPPPSN